MTLKLSQQMARTISPPGRNLNTEFRAKAKPTSEVISKAIGLSRISIEAPSKDSFQHMGIKETIAQIILFNIPFRRISPRT